jgi:hypothetical protein
MSKTLQMYSSRGPEVGQDGLNITKNVAWLSFFKGVAKITMPVNGMVMFLGVATGRSY